MRERRRGHLDPQLVLVKRATIVYVQLRAEGQRSHFKDFKARTQRLSKSAEISVQYIAGLARVGGAPRRKLPTRPGCPAPPPIDLQPLRARPSRIDVNWASVIECARRRLPDGIETSMEAIHDEHEKFLSGALQRYYRSWDIQLQVHRGPGYLLRSRHLNLYLQASSGCTFLVDHQIVLCRTRAIGIRWSGLSDGTITVPPTSTP